MIDASPRDALVLMFVTQYGKVEARIRMPFRGAKGDYGCERAARQSDDVF